jgi:hypothetical protein
MIAYAPTQLKNTATSTFIPGRRFLLQRKRACSGNAGASGECEVCSNEKRLQAKLAIGASNDPLEREADRVAEQVLATPAHAAVGSTTPQIQRLASAGQAEGQMGAAPASVDQALAEPGKPLEPALRHDMERRFGHDFSQVRVHADASAERSSREVNAQAYTVGSDIVFAASRYAPGSTVGQRLLAHELTHVVQQSAGVGSASLAHLQRNGNQAQAPKVVRPVVPNQAQQKMINDARRAAAIRTQVAMFRARGIEGATRYQEARRLAQIKFDWANPNMEQIGNILSNMGGGLVSVDVKVAGAGDAECGSRAGYVRGHQQPIVLCPAFFRDPSDNEGRIRTMIHEMAHVVGVGDASVGEQYFPVFDCDSKGAFESADSWANYVHCLSEQTPDKPITILGKPGGSQAPQTAPRSGGNK